METTYSPFPSISSPSPPSSPRPASYTRICGSRAASRAQASPPSPKATSSTTSKVPRPRSSSSKPAGESPSMTRPEISPRAPDIELIESVQVGNELSTESSNVNLDIISFLFVFQLLFLRVFRALILFLILALFVRVLFPESGCITGVIAAVEDNAPLRVDHEMVQK
ncbi:hypothetical protein HG530_002917 [Fusarium avenaceum]|nr:hypothetical protein HG530_002917 [Fusarium avenaceum]